jgi:hypothetical protein
MWIYVGIQYDIFPNGCSTLRGVMSIFALRNLINIYPAYGKLLHVSLVYVGWSRFHTGLMACTKKWKEMGSPAGIPTLEIRSPLILIYLRPMLFISYGMRGICNTHGKNKKLILNFRWNLERKKPLWRHRCEWEFNINVNFNVIDLG